MKFVKKNTQLKCKITSTYFQQIAAAFKHKFYFCLSIIKMTEVAQQMKDFIETHELVRNHMKILKTHKDKRKMLETEIIAELVKQKVSVVNVNGNKRIYFYSNPPRLSVYHTRGVLEIM